MNHLNPPPLDRPGLARIVVATAFASLAWTGCDLGPKNIGAETTSTDAGGSDTTGDYETSGSSDPQPTGDSDTTGDYSTSGDPQPPGDSDTTGDYSTSGDPQPPGDVCEGDLASDFFGITQLDLDGDVLLVDVQYGGGCETHDFTPCITGEGSGSNDGNGNITPPGADLTLVHNAFDDSCDASVNETLRVELRELLDPRYHVAGAVHMLAVYYGPGENDFETILYTAP